VFANGIDSKRRVDSSTATAMSAILELDSVHGVASGATLRAEKPRMESIVPIPVPLPHIRSVNVWLLRGEPLTLIDTGPRDDEALDALEAGLRRIGLRIEDIELVLPTHHHLDHTGLAATIVARSGAMVVASDRVAAYGERYAERAAADRRFSLALMAHHGVPQHVIAGNEGFWEYIGRTSEAFPTDTRLSDGDRIQAGSRELRVIARPGHSTTDTLFVDDRDGIAFVGDHLLAGISSNTEIYPAAEPDGTRPRARVEYLQNLKRTADMPLVRLLTGHGEPVSAHAGLVRRRLAEHRRRCERIAASLDSGPASAYAIAGRLWSARTVAEQPLLVVWEVLGHLDLLLDAGVVRERITDDGTRYGAASFELSRPGKGPSSGTRAPRARRPERAGRHSRHDPRR
jgi:glyoxylase-like metal-dependent hydrolase (beta-lactamase superfamily II)